MSKTLCVLPWMHFASHPNGGQSLCCRSNHKDAVSWAMKPGSTMLQTFDDTSLKTMANSETFVRVREAMLRGEQPVECEGCWADERAGLQSKRQYENERWAHVVYELEQTAVLKDPQYRYVELRLGNVCNNACVTCNSFSSSKWYADEVKISKELPWFELRPEQNFKWHDRPEFYTELAALSEHVEEIYINGGEPTLIKAHFKYLDALVESGQSKRVHLVYSLNLMDIPDRLVSLWEHFGRVTVNASIDDYKERNFYIRWPTEWSDVISSVVKLEETPSVQWHITQTVSIFNIFNLNKLENWAEEKFGKYTTFNYVLYPEHLSIAAIPPVIREEIKQHYADSSLSRYKCDELFAKLDSIEFKPEMQTRAREFVESLDRARNLNYREYIPELERILNADSN